MKKMLLILALVGPFAMNAADNEMTKAEEKELLQAQIASLEDLITQKQAIYDAHCKALHEELRDLNCQLNFLHIQHRNMELEEQGLPYRIK